VGVGRLRGGYEVCREGPVWQRRAEAEARAGSRGTSRRKEKGRREKKERKRKKRKRKRGKEKERKEEKKEKGFRRIRRNPRKN
jgi:hypothetical protein